MARHFSDGRADSIDDEPKQCPATSDSDSVSSASFQNLDFAVSTTHGSTKRPNGGSVRPNEPARPVQNVEDPAVTAAPQSSGEEEQQTEATTMASAPPNHQIMESSAPEDQRTRLQTAIIVVALCSGVMLAALDVTITTVAVPTISADFNSSSGYTWIGSAYLLANAAAAPSWGKLSDIFGRKPVLLTAVGIFWVGSLLCGVSVNMGMLILGRAVQGVGGGGILILVNICISDLFSVRRRGVYLGFVGLTWALAGGFGPVLGGVFTTKASWRWCFYVNLPVSGLGFATLYFTLKLHNPKTPIKQGLMAVDWLGSLTIVGGTLMFLLGLEMAGGIFPWNSPQIICLLVFGVFVASLCIVVEMYVATSPLIPVRLFSNVKNMAVLGLCACHGFVFISVSYYMPLYFQGVLGASALLSGVYVLPFTFVLGICSAAAGFLIKKTGKYKPPIIAGFALMTLGYGLFIDLDPFANWPKIIFYQIILGLGVGPNFQSPLIALQSTVKPRDIASATSTYMFVRQLSTSISIVVGGVIFNNAMTKQSARLMAEVGPDVAALLTGQNAAASVGVVAALPEPQRSIAQDAYFSALRDMFIFYVAFAGLGFLISFFVGGQTLSKQHTEHKTGLATLEKEKAPIADEEKAAAADPSAASAGLVNDRGMSDQDATLGGSGMADGLPGKVNGKTQV
ncbi:unnamed protein product [Discula destructiva]